MAQQFRALAVLPEDLGSISSTRMAALNQPNSSPRGSAASVASSGTRHTYGTQTTDRHSGKSIHSTHIIFLFKKK